MFVILREIAVIFAHLNSGYNHVYWDTMTIRFPTSKKCEKTILDGSCRRREQRTAKGLTIRTKYGRKIKKIRKNRRVKQTQNHKNGLVCGVNQQIDAGNPLLRDESI
mmetsp:Transcript_8863/g.13230  ORF Transcript_8863/g.13230 Transcript_8863/m.13230 type:complete len:107 (-) Transcript_8863:6-326(-)